MMDKKTPDFIFYVTKLKTNKMVRDSANYVFILHNIETFQSLFVINFPDILK